MSAEHLMVPTQNWLGTVAQNSVTTDPPVWSSSWYQQQWWPYYVPMTVCTPARPIKLTLAEIEHLRMHAAANPKLKAILQKFTAVIEILVEFD